MFKKPFKVKFNDLLKSSDKKKLLARLKRHMPQLGESELFTAKDDVTAIKVMTHSKTTAIVYRLNVAPIFFEVEGVIYPTAYTLWQHPRLLPAFVTFEAVIDILANGADLMLPGVSDVIFAGGEGQATVREGEPVNICTKENAACAAVGQSLVNDSGGAIRQSQTGKAVRVLHVCGDHLLLQLMDCVPHRPIISHQAYSEPQDQQSSIGDGSPLPGGASSAGASTDEPSGKENTIPAESVDVLITQLEQVQTEDTDQNTAIEPDMNDIADYCLLEGLCQKKLTLPILANLFYKNFMLVQVPPGLELNIKKTKYKKLSVMLKEMSAVKLLEFVDDKGVQSITKIDSSHALFRELRTSSRFEELMRRKKSAANQEAVANDNDSSIVSWERPVEIREDLIVNKVVSKVFEPYGFKKGDTVTTKQAREVIVSYIKDNTNTETSGKVDSKNVTIDPILADVQGTKSTTVPWADIVKNILDKMGSCYQIKTSKGRSLSGKGHLPKVEISTATRSGNKMVTLVNNMEKYGINVEECSKYCQHALAASATSHANSASTASGLQFQIQGNQKASISALLVERYGVPKTQILGFVEKKSKKKQP